jgi:hypothetical protein
MIKQGIKDADPGREASIFGKFPIMLPMRRNRL